MTKAGADYIRGIYKTALDRRAKAEKLENEVARVHGIAYHTSTIELCEAIAMFERFRLIELVEEGE